MYMIIHIHITKTEISSVVYKDLPPKKIPTQGSPKSLPFYSSIQVEVASRMKHIKQLSSIPLVRRVFHPADSAADYVNTQNMIKNPNIFELNDVTVRILPNVKVTTNQAKSLPKELSHIMGCWDL